MHLDAELDAIDLVSESQGPEALPGVEASVARLRAQGDAGRVARALPALARLLAVAARFDEADAAADEALAHFRVDGSALGCALALNAQGFTALRRGLPSRVLEVLDEAVRCAYEADDARVQMRVANTVGAAMSVLGRLPDAVQVLEDGLHLASEYPDEPVIARIEANLSWANARWALREFDAGAPEAAWRPRAQALADRTEATMAHWRARGEPERFAPLLDNLAVAYFVLGRGVEAHAVLDEAEILMSGGDGRFHSVALSCVRARILLDQGRHASALVAALRARNAAEERGGHFFIDEVYRLLSIAYERLGDWRLSLDAHKRYHDLRTRLVLQDAEHQASALAVALNTRRALRQAGEERLRADRSHHEARRDHMTGLPNRRAFLEFLGTALTNATAERPVTLVLVDLDHLKAINDRHRHAAGDAALRWVAAHLPAQCEPGDLAARLGGDEFALVLHAPLYVASAACDRLRSAIAHPAPGLPADVVIRISAGIAVAAAPCDVAQLFRRADDALYAAKASGRDAIQHAPNVRSSEERPA